MRSTYLAALSPSLLALLAVACGTSEEPEPPTPATCSVALAGEDALVEGGTSSFTVEVDGPVAQLSVADGFVGRVVLEQSDLAIRPDYGTGETTQAVTLSYTCDGRAETQVVELPVRAITWRPLPAWVEGDDGPLNREYGAMWIDPADPDAFFAFGGFHYRPSQFTPANELWRYDLAAEQWSQVEAMDAPYRPGGTVAVANGVAHLYGGLDGNDTPSSLFRIDTSQAPATFAEVTLTHEGDAAGDYQPSFVYDAPRDRFVTACGANIEWGMHCRVRVIDPATGIVSDPEIDGAPPEGRNGQFWVHDEAEQRIIVFSGFRDGGVAGSTFYADTWALELAEEPMRWVLLDGGEEGIAEGRRNGVFVLDPVGHRLFVWGGTPNGMTTSQGLFAFDLERGHEGWTQVEPRGEIPPPRASGHGIYDANRRRIVAGFGNGDGGLFGDLWALSL